MPTVEAEAVGDLVADEEGIRVLDQGARALVASPLLPDELEPVGVDGQGDHPARVHGEELGGQRLIEHHRHIGGLPAAVGQVDTYGGLGRTRHAQKHDLRLIQRGQPDTVVVLDGVVHRLDPLEVLLVELVEEARLGQR